MKVLRTPISELKYWNFSGIPGENDELKISLYNILHENNDAGVLYNTRVNSLVVLSRDELKLYKDYLRLKKADVSSFSKELLRLGFLNHSAFDEHRYMLGETQSPFQLQDNSRQFTILPTQKCNARCFYCFENDVNRLKMDRETETQLIHFIVENVKTLDHFILDWFGGEPLLEFNRITGIVNQIKSRTEVHFSSSITTNATLFTEERIQTAVSVWNLKRASITIDGIGEEHNRRKAVSGNINAFETTLNNIRCLLKHGVYVNLRVHIDKYNLYQLESILDYLTEFIRYDNFHLFVEKLFMPLQVKYHEDADRYILPEESNDFYKYMMIEMKKRGFVKDYDSFLASRRETSCMASRRDSVLINCDGMLYNCEQEFYDKDRNIGSIWTGIIYNRSYFSMISPKIEDTECSECQYLPTCLGGCRFTRSLCTEGHRYCMRGRILTPIAMNLLLKEYSE